MTTPAPLRREVEPPRPPVGPWMPISLLGTATMLTIATAFGVMTRMPRDVSTESVPAQHDDARILWLDAKLESFGNSCHYPVDAEYPVELRMRCLDRMQNRTLVPGSRVQTICLSYFPIR